MKVYILCENRDPKYFQNGSIIGIYTIRALVEKIKKMTCGDPNRIRLYTEELYKSIEEWVEQNSDEAWWLTLDINPGTPKSGSMFEMLGFHEDLKRYGILKVELQT